MEEPRRAHTLLLSVCWHKTLMRCRQDQLLLTVWEDVRGCEWLKAGAVKERRNKAQEEELAHQINYLELMLHSVSGSIEDTIPSDSNNCCSDYEGCWWITRRITNQVEEGFWTEKVARVFLTLLHELLLFVVLCSRVFSAYSCLILPPTHLRLPLTGPSHGSRRLLLGCNTRLHLGRVPRFRHSWWCILIVLPFRLFSQHALSK